MKLSNMGRIAAASILSLAGCLGVTACSRDYTVAFVYTIAPTTASNGAIDAYSVDYQSGALVRSTDSFSSGGRNPVAIIVTPNQKHLYVVNKDDNSVVWFKIGTDGKIYAQKTYNLPGSGPVAAAISPDSKFLYVLSTFENGASSGPGGLAILPITNPSDDNAGYALGSPVANGSLNYFPTGFTPQALVVSPDPTIAAEPTQQTTPSTNPSYVYVINDDGSATTTNPPIGNLLGFSRNASTGTITPLAGTTIDPTTGRATGYSSGVFPWGIVEDPAGHFIYVTDRTSNQLIGYLVSGAGANAGVPTAIQNGPFTTGSFPQGLTVDPRGKFVYVANNNSGSVSAFAIDAHTGSLSAVSGSTTTLTGTNPNCVAIEPALGIYLYTSNNKDSSITGLQLNPATGSLKNIQNTPFTVSPFPNCIVAVANGQHASQLINP
jgi:6-phosphogluconolactonase